MGSLPSVSLWFDWHLTEVPPTSSRSAGSRPVPQWDCSVACQHSPPVDYTSTTAYNSSWRVSQSNARLRLKLVKQFRLYWRPHQHFVIRKLFKDSGPKNKQQSRPLHAKIDDVIESCVRSRTGKFIHVSKMIGRGAFGRYQSINHLLAIITWGKTQRIQSVQMAGRPTTRQKLRL